MKTVNVNGFELPMTFKPKKGEKYYIPSKVFFRATEHNMCSGFDKDMISRGVYRTAEEAQLVAELLPRILRGERAVEL